MLDYNSYFKNKRITMLGLGVLGRGVNVAKFLAKHGAILTITDLKTAKELASSRRELRRYKNISYVLGKHELSDFQNRDMIIKAAGVPLDSPYVAAARKNKIPVEMDASLFAKLSPATIIGVTGTRGKSTVTHLIYWILKKAGKKVFLGGNIRGLATLPLLQKTKRGDVVVLELDSWQLQGFGPTSLKLRGASDGKGLSPHISVFTTFLDDHLNYYKGSRAKYFADKANIFKFQKKGDIFIAGPQVSALVKNKKLLARRSIGAGGKVKSKLIIPKAIPSNWKLKIPGEHNRDNVALATEAARALRIPDKVIRQAVENFSGVPGRLELVRTVRGVKIYNDTTATTPDATIVALQALGHPMSKWKKVVLIVGGADKGLDMKKLTREIPKYCKTVIFLKGTGTEKLKIESRKWKVETREFNNLKNAVAAAMKLAEKGDVVILSPAFASFGMFKNEYDRGERFNKIVGRL